MPEIKWQTQLTYLVEAGEADILNLMDLLDATWDPAPDIKPGTTFTVERELVDRFGPINVIQLLNSECKAAINRAGLKVELVKIALDAPGKLAPPKLPEPPQPPQDLVKVLHRDMEYLQELAVAASREEIQVSINQVAAVVGAIIDRTYE